MDDVLHTENLPQHFSRGVLRSVGTRQNRTDLCLHAHTHTHQVPSPLVGHKMHINQTTHTHIHKHTLYSLLSCSRSVFVQCSRLMCAELCLFVLSFCCLSCFARRHSTRSLGVWCFFFSPHQAVCSAACIGCSVQPSMCLYTHTHASLCLRHLHTSYSLHIAFCTHTSDLMAISSVCTSRHI